MSPADAQADRPIGGGFGSPATDPPGSPAAVSPSTAAPLRTRSAMPVGAAFGTPASAALAVPGADSDAEPRTRARRADAQRNRGLLLAAAKDVFAERGVDAPLDDIARRAGVGNATMYRHFPTRSDLIVAVYADEVTDLCACGDELAATLDPREALFRWLAEFIAHVTTKKELALAIVDDRSDARSTLFGQWHAAMHAATASLLTRAQQASAVRADLDVPDLLALANGIALSGAAPNRLDRLLALIREGVEIRPTDQASSL